MKIIVPLAGSGDGDFIEKFNTIKPLTKVGNLTMLEKFINNFYFKYEFLFICNFKDLIETNLLNSIKSLKIKKKIISIKNKTSNIIETIRHAKDHIKNNEKITIIHPDGINFFFSKKKVKLKFDNPQCDGFLFALNEQIQSNNSETHTGRLIFENNKVTKIAEKSPKTENSKRLAGIYFFKKWSEFIHYSNLTFENQEPVHGRYFVSQVYNEYLRDNRKIEMFLVKKNVSFGLVSQVKEYNFWHDYFKKNYNRKSTQKFNFINLIPSCGDGIRFLGKKKNFFKPLIKVDKKNMINKTIDSLPKAKKNVIIIRKDHDEKYNFSKKIKRENKNIEVFILNKKTSGMASTCYEYVKKINKKIPLLISSCDYAVIFDEKKFSNIINNLNPDVVIWSFKNYPDARLAPNAYAYLEVSNGLVKKISEKKPISSHPHLDHIAQGIFYFKSAEIFLKATKEMFKKKRTINNEYYVGNSINELINKNYTVLPFQVDQYICLGTPRDLNVYKYWFKIFK
jgi:choline kinase